MIHVRFERSDALLETLERLYGVAYRRESATMSFRERWVQLTYDELRFPPEGEPLARYRTSIDDHDLDGWVTRYDPLPWSDVIVYYGAREEA